MKPLEPWAVLLAKAAQDEYVVDTLIDLADSPDEVLGFHLQQAAEKILKAALLSLNVEYRFTHNLGELVFLIKKSGCTIPADLDEIRELTPYATEWRYDFIPDEGSETLDRKKARDVVARLRIWVEALIKNRTTGG